MRTLEEIRNPLDALLRIFSEAIYTMNVLHIKRKQGVKEDIARARAKLSAYWGWIGGRINRIFQDKKQRNKVDPDVAVKCFELSLKLRKRNKKSSNGIAWSLLFSGKADEAIKAFEYDLKEINKDNPASLIGIGRAYEEKGEYSVATRYLKDGAKLRFEKRYEEKPQLSVEVLARAIRRLERIAFLSNSMDERLKILKDALEVYGMLKEILGEVVLDSTQLQDLELVEDEQNLFPLRMNILKRYVSDLENALKTKNA
jgi:tetratricopeptide (TPR) repeat protein